MRYGFLFFWLTSFVYAQQVKFVDFTAANASIEVNPVKRNVVGTVSYSFVVNAAIDSIRIDAQKMTFSDLMINGKAVKFHENKKQLLLFEGYRLGENTLTFSYEAFPTQTMYFVNWDFTTEVDTPEEVAGQIWTQGQGKYTSHWLPSFDDPNEKLFFGLKIKFHKSFDVISNGELVKKELVGDDLIWHYKMKKPMSSYLVMLAIGRFEKQDLRSRSGVPLHNYYEKSDRPFVASTYKSSKEVFDFLESEIGVAYPWEIYRQIPVHDFLYAGMENTTATLFSRDFIVDSIGFIDRNYININAHELAHQWFGNLVTAKSGRDHWLQEGFATYYALLAERKIFGDDYFYNKLYLMSRQLTEAAKSDTIPVLNEKASSLSFYQKGAWALHFMREKMGKKKFDTAVKNYLKKYAYQNVSTDDFLNEVQKVSNFDTAFFRKKWLEESAFPVKEADELLLKNAFIRQYFSLRENPLELSKNRDQILKIMQSDVYYPIKELLIYQTASESFENRLFLLEAAMQTNQVLVRQAVANSMKEIPVQFKASYETFLNDASYETRETALYNLWKAFPESRDFYLEVSKDWIGFQDMNLRMAHLYLKYLTVAEPNAKQKVYMQLLQLTGTNYDSNVQQQALQKLLSLEIHTEDVFRGLAYGTAHHRWQFAKFCRDRIRALIEEKQNKEVFLSILPKLPVRERVHLQRLLNEKETVKK